MWVNRKYYEFLKRNAENNIDAEYNILLAKENEKRAVARAMEEYSAVLKERDKIKEDLKYYLDTNEENGVVYIPKFVIEKIVNNA